MTPSLTPEEYEDRADALGSAVHTKGPWLTEYRARPDGTCGQDVFDADGNTIATCNWYPVECSDGWLTNREANARLIAAAPDLLEALQFVREYYVARATATSSVGAKVHAKDLAKIDATISKATGGAQ